MFGLLFGLLLGQLLRLLSALSAALLLFPCCCDSAVPPLAGFKLLKL
jgi:hypothetical protein